MTRQDDPRSRDPESALNLATSSPGRESMAFGAGAAPHVNDAVELLGVPTSILSARSLPAADCNACGARVPRDDVRALVEDLWPKMTASRPADCQGPYRVELWNFQLIMILDALRLGVRPVRA